ncbi:MAG: hypothetical protein QM651_02785 [Rhodoblastus sp.]
MPIAAAGASGAAVWRATKNIRAPLWVGLAAARAFVAVGAAIVAQGLQAPRVGRYALLGLLLAMLAPPAWIAFGLGAVLLALMLLVFLSKWARGTLQ